MVNPWIQIIVCSNSYLICWRSWSGWQLRWRIKGTWLEHSECRENDQEAALNLAALDAIDQLLIMSIAVSFVLEVSYRSSAAQAANIHIQDPFLRNRISCYTLELWFLFRDWVLKTQPPHPNSITSTPSSFCGSNFRMSPTTSSSIIARRIFLLCGNHNRPYMNNTEDTPVVRQDTNLLDSYFIVDKTVLKQCKSMKGCGAGNDSCWTTLFILLNENNIARLNLSEWAMPWYMPCVNGWLALCWFDELADQNVTS